MAFLFDRVIPLAWNSRKTTNTTNSLCGCADGRHVVRIAQGARGPESPRNAIIVQRCMHIMNNSNALNYLQLRSLPKLRPPTLTDMPNRTSCLVGLVYWDLFAGR